MQKKFNTIAQLIKAYVNSVKGEKKLFYGFDVRKLTRRTTLHLKEDSPVTFICRVVKYPILRYLYFKNAFRWWLVKLRTRDEYIKREILGSELYLDPNDPGISQELICVGVREPYSVETVQRIVKPGDTVVDIGANIGYYALLEAKLVGEKGRVYAVEPVPSNFELLKKNIELNNYRNIETFQAAMSSENGIGDIYLSPYRNWCKMLKHPMSPEEMKKNAFFDKIPVKVMTLDKFLEGKRPPDLIRMDVEGYELEIMNGAQQLLRSGRPLKLYIEFHPSLLKKEGAISLLKMLKSFGFRFEAIFLEPHPYVWQAPKFIQKLIDITNKKIIGFESGHFTIGMDDLIKGDLFLKEERVKGGLAIFFGRN